MTGVPILDRLALGLMWAAILALVACVAIPVLGEIRRDVRRRRQGLPPRAPALLSGTSSMRIPVSVIGDENGRGNADDVGQVAQMRGCFTQRTNSGGHAG